MIISRNKPLQIFTSLLMILIILISFTVKPYSEAFLLSGVGLKVFGAALASGGVLLTAESFEGGVSGLYEGFQEHVERVNGIRDVGFTLAKAGINSVYNNTKMKLNNLVIDGTGQVLNITDALTDYLSSLNASLPETGVIDTIPGAYFDDILYYSGSIGNLYYSAGKVSLGAGYEIRPEIDITDNKFEYLLKVYKDDIRVTSHKYAVFLEFTNWNALKDDVSFQVRHQLVGDLLYVGIYGHNYATNAIIDEVLTIPFERLVGLDTSPTVETWKNKGFPIPQTLPGEIAFPWGLAGVDYPSYVGKTLDELLEGINSMPLNPYLEGLGGLTKEQVDSFPLIQVETDVEGIITDIPVPDVPDVQAPSIDLDVPVGLLGSIAGFLQKIWEWLQDMFTVPDDISLDFAPLKALIPKEKFPFSIPWDYASLIGLFRSDPIPPKFEIEILNEELVIDFTQFEMWAKITRNTLSVIFLVGLMFSTRKLMIGGS